ncbi:MAG: hypothetical protein J5I99_08955 [Verrucomicrobia bacterium]|nr:hypothetical protein [Verrucomicrobiota bacterium]
MKTARVIIVALLVATAVGAQTSPPPALTRATKGVVQFPTHLVEQREAGNLRWYSMMDGKLWIARDASGRTVEEWDLFATGSWRERRTGRTIVKVGNTWRADNGDTLRRTGPDAEIRDASGFRVNTVRRAP